MFYKQVANLYILVVCLQMKTCCYQLHKQNNYCGETRAHIDSIIMIRASGQESMHIIQPDTGKL